MKLIYESSDGKVIDLMGNAIYAQEPESLLSSTWDYNEISGANGLKRIKKFYRKTQSCNLMLDIMADTKSEFNIIMDTLRKAFDGDVKRLQPGKIWWNDYYKQVYVVETSHDDFDELFESVTSKLTIISPYPYWIKEHTTRYPAMTESIGTLDYGMDGYYEGFDYCSIDYGQSDYVDIIRTSGIGGSNFEITFYGPASDPSVTIGDHEYQVYDSIADGEYITVESIGKKIVKHKLDGTIVNDFYRRNKDSYIFEPIPDGELTVLKSRDISVDIKIYNERSEPKWI